MGVNKGRSVDAARGKGWGAASKKKSREVMGGKRLGCC